MSVIILVTKCTPMLRYGPSMTDACDYGVGGAFVAELGALKGNLIMIA